MLRRAGQLSGLSLAARWPIGILWTSWRYMWRTTPVHRWELTGSPGEDSPAPLPTGVDLDRVQDIDAGVGALFHRVYRTSIRGSDLSPAELVAVIAADLDALVPSGLAKFQKVVGEPGGLSLGDEYVVRLPGPWDGPVRVVAVEADAFRLVTLAGHLEAGQITFRARTGARSLEFDIESWARSGDRLSDLLYSHLRMAKEVQLHLWTSVLARVVTLAHGRMDGGIRVVTRRVESAAGRQPPRRARRRLAQLAERSVNFEVPSSGEYQREAGWRVDDMSTALPREPHGEPVPGATWLLARQIMHDYQVADPAQVRSTFDRDAPLKGRDMLLEVRYLGLRLHVGVRVGAPYDEIRVLKGRQVRVFGWSYHTLEGHFEEGEMHYQVWKWLDDGAVEFRLLAYSRPASTGPRCTRWGYRILGRRQQLTFYRSACRRMRRLTEAQLDLADVGRNGAGPAA